MRFLGPLILLLAVPAVACSAPDGDQAGMSPRAATPASSSPAPPSPSPTAAPTPRPTRSAVAWADMPPVSPTSIDFEPDVLPPLRGSVPVSTPVSEMVDQQPTKYTAVIINTPGLIVTLPDGKDLAERKKAIQARTKVPLSFIVAVQSRAEQEHLQKQLANELMKPHAPDVTPVVVGVGSDSRGAVTVILHEDLDDSDTVGLRQSLKERYGVGVVFGKSGIPRAGPG